MKFNIQNETHPGRNHLKDNLTPLLEILHTKAHRKLLRRLCPVIEELDASSLLVTILCSPATK